MRAAIIGVFVSLSATAALADGFVLGAGRWTCDQVVEVYERGSPIDKGQLAGWILGYWSAATFQRETGFVDTVERVGGQNIYEATVAECRKAPPETLVFRVSDSIIRNTK